MSAYSDWKVGALSDEEYSEYCAWEDRRDKAVEMSSDWCDHYRDGKCELGCDCRDCE